MSAGAGVPADPVTPAWNFGSRGLHASPQDVSTRPHPLRLAIISLLTNFYF
jgi:hypothetical protein